MAWHTEVDDPIEAAVAEAMAPESVDVGNDTVALTGNVYRQGDRDAGPNGDIRAAQTVLTRLGTDVGEVDGVYGRNTMNAVQYAQEMLGLPRTGVLDQTTQDRFNSLTDDEIAFFTSETEAIVEEAERRDSVDSEVYASRGAAYRPDQIKSYSYYNEPLQGEGPRGVSRIHGDASTDVQTEAIQAIIREGRNAGMSNEDIALTLAIARHESGFNPDASAGTTSAHGLGQFVNKTGEAYGITDENRWDVNTQARALVEHTIDNIRLAERKGQGREYVYAYHHDGPSLQYGGLEIGKRSVTPNVSKFLEIVTSRDEE